MNKPLQHVRILLVEDDPIIALDLRETLEAAGAAVIGPAPDAASALTMLQDRTFDAAVLDHLIVGGDSVAVADELARRGMRFLFHTSHRGGCRRSSLAPLSSTSHRARASWWRR